MSHLPMALVYAILIFAIRGVWWQLNWALMFSWVWWIVGVAVGVLILFLDRVAYTYAYPGEQLSQQAQWYFKQRQYLSGLALLDTRRLEQEKLTFRSALFMVVWVPLAFFTLTSTPVLFGKGVVMGLMLHILLDAWRLQRTDGQRLHVRLFWMIKRVVSNEERIIFLWIMTGIFVLFSFWVS
jgi:hypothetical protein